MKMLKIEGFLGKISWVVSLISYVALIAIMLLNVADILANKFMNTHIPGTQELSEQFLLCTVMAAFAYGQYKKSHINMTMLLKRLPNPVKFGLFGLMGLLSSATAIFAGYAAQKQVGVSLTKNYVTEVLLFPKWPFYTLEAVCFFVFAVLLLYDGILSLMAIGNKEIADKVTSTWTD